jgi:anthranilate synthase component 2
VIRAPELMHGKLSPIHHDGRSLFRGLPDGFEATRYHSLIVEAGTLPHCLSVTARTAEGLIMGLEHQTQPTFGVQFHPESIASNFGHAILANFLTLAGIGWTPRHDGIILPEPLTLERRRAFG